MIMSKSYNITLAYIEMSALEDYLNNIGMRIRSFVHGASFSASREGVTIYCVSKQQADKLWEVVLKATDLEENVD